MRFKVYIDYTTEATPRAFYVGKGSVANTLMKRVKTCLRLEKEEFRGTKERNLVRAKHPASFQIKHGRISQKVARGESRGTRACESTQKRASLNGHHLIRTPTSKIL